MKIFLAFLLIISSLYYGTLVSANSTTPNCWNPFNNYGFEVGHKYTRQFINNDPFNTKSEPIDTLEVKAFAKDFVQFTNGDTKRFGSMGMGFYQWKKL